MSLALTQYFLSFCLCLLSCCAPLSLSLHLGVCFSIRLPFFAWTRWRDALLQTFLTQDHNALSHVIRSAISCLSLSLSLSLSIHKRSFFSFFLSILSPLTKPDKGLSFLLACLSSVCLYCTKVVSLSHCILSLSLQRRCLGAAGALLWDKGPASAQRGRWQGWEGVCVVSERTRGRRKSKSDRVYYFIKCFGARQGLGSKTLQLCVWQGRDLPQPGNSIHTHCAAFIWYWGCVRALSHWCWLTRWRC